MKKAIFLDRDGTINVDKDHLFKIEDFEFIPGMIDAIRFWNENKYLVIVITNQSGIARGLYTEKDVLKLHIHINQVLSKYNAQIDAFYFCPHHPTEGIGEYKIECNCRKPKTGLIERAVLEHDIDISKSFLFGDNIKDIKAGEKMSIKSLLVNGKDFNLEDYKNLF